MLHLRLNDLKKSPRMAGPPIPEDEDVTNTPQHTPWAEPQA